MMRYSHAIREKGVFESLTMFKKDDLQASCDDLVLRGPEEEQLLLWCSEEVLEDAHEKAALEGNSCFDNSLSLFSESQQKKAITPLPPPSRTGRLPKLMRSVSNETAGGSPHSNDTGKKKCVTNEVAYETSSFLHRTCQLFSQSKDVVAGVLVMEPESTRKSIRIPCVQHGSSGKQRVVMERYTYPINIALSHNADPAVIEVLANAAPDVLVLQDGRDNIASLSIALSLRRHQQSTALSVQALLDANPGCVCVVDRFQNLPLHIACAKGVSLEVVQKVYRAYPEALKTANFWCKTPLDVAQSNDACSEDVVDFLQQEEVKHIKVDLL